MSIQKNCLIQWNGEDGRLERVLHVDRQNNLAVTYELPVNRKKSVGMPQHVTVEELHSAVETGAAQIVFDDPYRVLKDGSNGSGKTIAGPVHMLSKEKELPKEHRKKRDELWRMLGPALQGIRIFDRDERGKILKALQQKCKQQKCKMTKPTFYKYLHRWWEAGQIRNAFLPLLYRCGGKGQERLRSAAEEQKGKHVKRGRPSKLAKATKKPTGANMTVEMKQRLLRGLRIVFHKHKGITFAEAFRKVIESFFISGTYDLKNGVLVPILLPPNMRPSEGEARYWYQRKDGWFSDLKIRKGERACNLKFRALVGSPTQRAFGPGSCFQIDSTIVDLYLVSQLNRRRIVGRPVIYIVIDVFSRLIVGFYVGLEAASWRSALMALKNTVADKATYCQSLKLTLPITTEEWPCHHLPETICADRGAEYMGYGADDLVNGLGIEIDSAGPYRADWKGLIEQQFRLINNREINWIPGAVYEPRKLMGEDYRLDACLDLHEFRCLTALLVYQHNNVQPVHQYPYDEFMLQDDMPVYPVDLWHWGLENRSHVREWDPNAIPHLLPSDDASVTAKGILFRRLYYSCSVAIKGRWFEKARVNGVFSIRVSYDQGDTSVLFARLDDGRLEECHLLDRHNAFAHRHWDDVQDSYAHNDQERQRKKPEEEQQKTAVRAHRQAIVKKAIEEKKQVAVTQSKTAQIKGIRQNRRDEQIIERSKGNSGQEAKSPNADDEYVAAPDRSALLAKLRRSVRK